MPHMEYVQATSWSETLANHQQPTFRWSKLTILIKDLLTEDFLMKMREGWIFAVKIA